MGGVRRAAAGPRLVLARRAMTPRWRHAAVIWSAALCGVAGCVAPTPTESDYAASASSTVETVLSEVQTARLAVEASEQHRATRPYLSQLLGDAETAAA